MNKLLLIAVAGALFAAGPAHADPLPGADVGVGCFVKDNPNSPGTPGDKTCSGIFNTRAIRTLKINLKGYEWTNADAADGTLCKFVSIKHTGRKAAPSCHGANDRDIIFQLSLPGVSSRTNAAR
ncbi:MAG: hypothetical protein WCB74_25935 [Pseudolabrys sp.]